MNITRSQLKTQYDRAVRLGWLPFFQEAADTITKGYFDAADLMGIGSRETNLDPKWLRQLGDGGHAGGLMQADIRSFPDFISSGEWKDARQSILFGARVLMLKWQDYEAHIGMNLSVKGHAYTAKKAEGEVAQHIVISSYNCGRWSQYCYAEGIDIDKYSTGHDYGADVMQRAIILRTFLTDSAAASPGSSANTSESNTTDSATPSANAAADTSVQPVVQTADTIVNTGDNTPTPAPQDITMNAPQAMGSVQGSAKVTILGIGVPACLVAFFKMLGQWFQDGTLDVKAAFNTVSQLIAENFKYIIILACLVVVVIMLKKVERIVVFIVSMITHAIPSWNAVSVIGATPAPPKSWKDTLTFGLVK